MAPGRQQGSLRPHEPQAARIRIVCDSRVRFTCRGRAARLGDGAPLGASGRPAGALLLPARAPAGNGAPAPPLWEFEEAADLLLGHDPELIRQSRRAVHKVGRLEHRLQRWAATRLPAGVRRLIAGGLAGAVGKTATAPLETVKMQLVQSGGATAIGAATALWQRGGAGAFFRCACSGSFWELAALRFGAAVSCLPPMLLIPRHSIHCHCLQRQLH